MDLSGPYRTSGLGPGAKLELIQKSNSPSVVAIALDVLGRRFTKKLTSDMALWQVLRQFESAEKDLNITGRATPKSGDGGQLYYERPVVNIMGREYSALEDLQKTLSQCGIRSGSMVLRISFKSTDKTLYSALWEIGQYFKDVDPAPPTDEKKPDPEPTATEGPKPEQAAPVEDTPGLQSTEPEHVSLDTKKAESNKAPDAMDVDETPEASARTNPLQPVNVFSAPSSSTPVAAQIREDDAVYEPTIAHAQLRQQQLLARTQNTRLKSDAELAAVAAEAAAKLAKITKVDVKVRFPDQTSAQWVVGPEHTGAFLYRAIRGVMAHPNQPFKLIMSGPNSSIHEDNKLLIAGYKLKSRELLNLLWEDAASAQARSSSFLKGSIASQAKAVVVPEVPQTASNDAEASAGPSTKPVNSGSSESKADPDALRKKIGKLFRLPGKK